MEPKDTLAQPRTQTLMKRSMLRVLLIDDVGPIRFIMRRMLEPAGHEVWEARDGFEGLALANQHNFDIVLTDIWMPVIDGIAFIRAVRLAQPTIRLVAVSGGNGQASGLDSLDLARAAGADAILRKPFLECALIAAIDLAMTIGPAGRPL